MTSVVKLTVDIYVFMMNNAPGKQKLGSVVISYATYVIRFQHGLWLILLFVVWLLYIMTDVDISTLPNNLLRRPNNLTKHFSIDKDISFFLNLMRTDDDHHSMLRSSERAWIHNNMRYQCFKLYVVVMIMMNVRLCWWWQVCCIAASSNWRKRRYQLQKWKNKISNVFSCVFDFVLWYGSTCCSQPSRWHGARQSSSYRPWWPVITCCGIYDLNRIYDLNI